MRARAMSVLVACALSVLAACSPKPDGEAAKAAPANDSPAAKANAEFARLQAQGPDATAREFTKTEYALTRSLMKAGGLDAALGGEAKADAALTALFMDYERKGRALQAELPKAFAPVNEGGGGNRGGARVGVARRLRWCWVGRRPRRRHRPGKTAWIAVKAAAMPSPMPPAIRCRWTGRRIRPP